MDHVSAVRHFNRTYTPRIGALEDSFLGSGLPLGAARVLFEIGPGGASVLALRRRLGVDSGYLSRLLRRLEADGLIVVEADPDDRRRRRCRLTATGRRRWARLDARSDGVAEQLLAPLSPGQRTRLAAALATADRLLRAAAVDLVAVDPTGGGATAAMTAYFEELDARFPGGFDAGDATGPGARSMGPPDGAFVLAVGDDGAGEQMAVACGGLQRVDARTAEIKRMWVHSDWRGLGLGRRLLADLERRASDLAYEVVVLDTNSVLVEAIAMYQSAGYEPIERYNDNPYAQRWFRKALSA